VALSAARRRPLGLVDDVDLVARLHHDGLHAQPPGLPDAGEQRHEVDCQDDVDQDAGGDGDLHAQHPTTFRMSLARLARVPPG
jgi:hypothetical protein